MVRLYLVTANVGSVFDNIEHGLPVWLNEFSSVVRSRDPEFLAIHFQETGGKSCEFASDAIKEFFRQLVDRMEQLNFRLAEGFVDSTSKVEEEFTALSSIYFVHESLRRSVHIWDFQDRQFHHVDRCVNPSSTELHPNIHLGSSLNLTHRKQKEKFPKDFYPNSKWSRKGFLRTRWRFGRTILDLVNIHLFHDSCNLKAASDFPSTFAQHREMTLKYTIDRIQSDGLEKSPLFIFGDFNFRINANGVMEILKQEFGDPVPKSSENHSIVLGTKKFHCPDQELRFKHSFEWLKQHDFEVNKFPGILQEHDLNFHPTYPFAEDMNEPEKFMRTRLPAWCDRVLFTPSTRDIFVQDFPIDYNLIGSKVCMGDHKPVGLRIKIHTNGDHPPTLNSTGKKVDTTGIIPTIDTTSPNALIKPSKPVGKMTKLILELAKSSDSLTANATPTTLISSCDRTSVTIVNNDNNTICSNNASSWTCTCCRRSLQNDSKFNSTNGNPDAGEGLGKSTTNLGDILHSYHDQENLSTEAIELSLESPTISATDEESNCLFGAFCRRRGRVGFSHNKGNCMNIGSNNGGGNGKPRSTNCSAFSSGLKALSKCKRSGGGSNGITSMNRSCSLLEPIAGAGCDFACSSLPSSGAPSHRPSMVAGILPTTTSDFDDAHAKLSNGREKNDRSTISYFRNFFTAPSAFPDGKAVKCKSRECYRKYGGRCCCCNSNGLSVPSPPHSTGIEASSAGCRCQNMIMLNIATMISNNCNNRQNNLHNSNGGDLPLGSSNLSLIAINSNSDPDKQTFDGKINGCCNLENGCINGKIPVSWATTTTNMYNNSNNLTKLSSGSSCANCNNMNNKNLHNNYLQTATEKNSNSAKGHSKKCNGLSFNFRGRSSSQGSATLQDKCKCHIKEGMSRTTGGCVSCSKCVIL